VRVSERCVHVQHLKQRSLVRLIDDDEEGWQEGWQKQIAPRLDLHLDHDRQQQSA